MDGEGMDGRTEGMDRQMEGMDVGSGGQLGGWGTLLPPPKLILSLPQPPRKESGQD